MKTWQEDEIQALLTLNDEQALFSGLAGLARDLGFDFCAYGMRLPIPVSNPKIVMFNNYPGEWQSRYERNNYLAVDPTVQHGMRSLLPILWSDEVFASSRELWEEAQSFGLRIGWAQATWDANGVGGLLTLARPAEALSSAELQTNSMKLAWLAQVAHIGMSQCLRAKMMPQVNVKLSNREVEVLRWTADGKTSSEISDILRIAERTVNFHINNAISKLNASNKTAAVVRAAMLGMLY